MNKEKLFLVYIDGEDGRVMTQTEFNHANDGIENEELRNDVDALNVKEFIWEGKSASVGWMVGRLQ